MPNPVTLPNTEVHMLQSSKVEQEYKLFISLPSDYATSKQTYPVLYMTDANWLFSLFQVVGLLPVPPMIVVGIGYPIDDFNEIYRLRARDFLPTKSIDDEAQSQDILKMTIESGGASQFLSFIREELFSFINTQYRTNPDDRTLWGYSYGGTFCLYTLFNHLDAFTRYIIGAPTLSWDNRVSFKYEHEYAENATDLPTKLHLSIGTLDEDEIENTVSLMFEFYVNLKNRNYPNLNLKFDVYNDETHLTGIMPCISWGVRSVFS